MKETGDDGQDKHLTSHHDLNMEMLHEVECLAEAGEAEAEPRGRHHRQDEEQISQAWVIEYLCAILAALLQDRQIFLIEFLTGIIDVKLSRRIQGILEEEPDDEIIDRTKAEEQRKGLHVALAPATEIVAHHVTWAPEEPGDGTQDAIVEVGNKADAILDQVLKGEATDLAALATMRTEIACEMCLAVLADTFLGRVRLLVYEM